MKKNAIILTALLLALTMVLGACGGSSSAGTSSSGSSAASSGGTTGGTTSGGTHGDSTSSSGTSGSGSSGGVATPVAPPSTATPPSPNGYLNDPADGLQYYSGSGESYLVIDENSRTLTENESMLTFSLKVDTSAYSNIQRYIENGMLPPKDAVRTEELINYFRYDTDLRFGRDPFAVYAEVAPSPFDAGKLMAFIRVKTPEIDKRDLPRSSLTFLIDVSGSMSSHDKLPLLKDSFALLADTLSKDDVVSIVTYAGESRVVLDSVSGADKKRIKEAIDSLKAGGSTAGGEGIQAAYKLAEKNFISGGNNRVILATDGDFNVGVSSNAELSRLIKEKKESGVYLSVLGYGMGNIRDDLMETLSRDGNGNYSYINSLRMAQKVLVEELAANIFTVADDVKAQVEFNPENVRSYRLIGYENRALDNRDFADDTKDAGEIGAGTDIIVLFEIELYDPPFDSGMKYQSGAAQRERDPDSQYADELFEVRIRYKYPGESQSNLLTYPVTLDYIRERGGADFDFACAVAAFSDMLRGSRYADTATVSRIFSVAEDNLGKDDGGYRADFLALVNRYRRLVMI